MDYYGSYALVPVPVFHVQLHTSQCKVHICIFARLADPGTCLYVSIPWLDSVPWCVLRDCSTPRLRPATCSVQGCCNGCMLMSVSGFAAMPQPLAFLQPQQIGPPSPTPTPMQPIRSAVCLKAGCRGRVHRGAVGCLRGLLAWSCWQQWLQAGGSSSLPSTHGCSSSCPAQWRKLGMCMAVG